MQLFLDDLLVVLAEQRGFLAVQDGTAVRRSCFFMFVYCDALKNGFGDGPFVCPMKIIIPDEAKILALAGGSVLETEEELMMVELVLGGSSKRDVSGLAV